MATLGNYNPYVESISPSSPVSPPPGITSSMLFDDSNHNLDLETPHLVTFAVFNDISSLVNKCRQKHDQVIQRHCLTNGINFSPEDTNRFLLQNHLEEALDDAEEDSYTFLNMLLQIPPAQDHHEMIRNQLKEFFRTENLRIKREHTSMQDQFIKKAKGRIWTNFVEKVEARYYFLFQNFTSANRRQFYNHDRMKQYITNLVNNSRDNCRDYQKVLEGNLENGGQQQRSVSEAYKSFQDFMYSIKKAEADLIAKNQKNEDYSRTQIIDNLIIKEYGLKCKSTLKELIDKEPNFYSNEENIKKVVYGELNKKAFEAITTYVKSVCLEESDVFQNIFTRILQEKAKELVQDGLAFAKQKEEEIQKTYDLIHSKLSNYTAEITKALPAADAEKLRAGLLAEVGRARKDRKSGSVAPSPTASTGQPELQNQSSPKPSLRPSPPLSSPSVSAGKHPSADNNDPQTPTLGKRVRTLSSSTSPSPTCNSGSPNSGNNSRGRESLPIKIAYRGIRPTRP